VTQAERDVTKRDAYVTHHPDLYLLSLTLHFGMKEVNWCIGRVHVYDLTVRCIKKLESKGLTGVLGHRRGNSVGSEEFDGVGSLGQGASRSSVGGTTEVISAEGSESTIGGEDGLLGV
jgi:hypothetical protein